ncbi:hypothetical protein Y5W_02887 [Alcanivorax sp. 521-1]|uniref:Uncharacterized protein n=1 Tax=Alloalcanivorax profundimaris TaxID=2735259 RepID=A0ABS0AU05_9GAMM|nr:hypothetical protein [Alloalcanivorax profundimaris]
MVHGITIRRRGVGPRRIRSGLKVMALICTLMLRKILFLSLILWGLFPLVMIFLEILALGSQLE